MPDQPVPLSTAESAAYNLVSAASQERDRDEPDHSLRPVVAGTLAAMLDELVERRTKGAAYHFKLPASLRELAARQGDEEPPSMSDAAAAIELNVIELATNTDALAMHDAANTLAKLVEAAHGIRALQPPPAPPEAAGPSSRELAEQDVIRHAIAVVEVLRAGDLTVEWFTGRLEPVGEALRVLDGSVEILNQVGGQL